MRQGKSRPDKDARIGYCAAKKLAFIGYRLTIGLAAKEGVILDFALTPANVHDGKTFPTLWNDLNQEGLLRWIKEVYGDNAYASITNEILVTGDQKKECFHSKEETGKHPKNPKQAHQKSKIRSKIEAANGILCMNYNLEHIRVRGLPRVRIEMALTLCLWNLLLLLAYIEDRIEDKWSVRQLFGHKTILQGEI